jgi:predicted MPP superfamily phosphohydrolase
LRQIRHFGIPFIALTPLFIWLVYGFDVFGGEPADGTVVYASFLYAVVCCAVGLIVMPLITLQRLLRRQPAALHKSFSRVVDVEADLGARPTGHGKYRRLASLPFNEVFQVEFSERILSVPELPEAWDGLTILHLTDLHFCGTPDRAFYHRVIDHCLAWGTPDLLAVTGDIADSARHHRWIIPVLGRLRSRHGSYAILGNHDSYYDPALVRRRLKRLGMRVLANSWDQITLRGEPLIVIGHEGPWFGQQPDLSDCPAGAFRVCLSHSPDNIDWARRHGVGLMLAGHNHGGQIRFPLIGSVFVPSRYSRRYDCGTFHEPPTILHVSRGLAGQHPLRYLCRPEVTWIVLRATQ